MDYVGWFTEHVSEDDPGFDPKHPRYRATLQLPGWVVTTQGPWFETEADCDDFIRTEIVGMGLLPPRR